MNAVYSLVNSSNSRNSSSLDSFELEMTSLQNNGEQSTRSTSNLGLSLDHAVVPRSRRAATPSTCNKRTIIFLIILIPIGLAALVFCILLATGVVNTETLGITATTDAAPAFVTCKDDEMRCDNGYECLNNFYVCDGEEHCSDNSDERGCPGGCPLSPRLFFFCNNGDCIKMSWKCDRERDCSDGEDELNCEKCNATTEFTCYNYNCVDKQARCDGRFDCPDRSDEYSCFKQVSDTIKYSSNGSWIDLCHSPDVTSEAGRLCALLGHRSEGATSSAIPRDNSSALAVYIQPYTEQSKTNGTFIISSDSSCRLAVNLQCKACGTSTKQVWAAYLVGGDGGFPISDWPWHVKVNIGSSHICGGSIISDRWVLTAAHCVSGYTSKPSEVIVVYGTNKFSGEGGVRRTVRRVVIHPQYTPTLYEDYFTTYSYDLALLEVDTMIYSPNAQPACLPTQDDILSDHTTCYITGFGSIINSQSAPRYPAVLQEGKSRVWSRQECDRQYQSAFRLTVPENWICAGYQTAGIDSCVGDSGGPLVCLTNSHWVLQGVVSWGNSCKQSLPSIYARVSKGMDWINQYVN